MIRSLFHKHDAGGAPVPMVPDGMRVYAIGDIHGRADLLEPLASRIRHEAASCGLEIATIVLGDMIDRGPASRAVVTMLSEGALPGLTALRGNHEDMLLSALDDAELVDVWWHNGGLETLASYGVDATRALIGQGREEAMAAFRRQLPDQHLAFLQALPLSREIGDYFFCHAGIRPGIALDRQASHDLLWIRDKFLSNRRQHGKVIVHGHTPVRQAEMLDNRINIDTGAFATGRLTCLVLEGSSRELIEA